MVISGVASGQTRKTGQGRGRRRSEWRVRGWPGRCGRDRRPGHHEDGGAGARATTSRSTRPVRVTWCAGRPSRCPAGGSAADDPADLGRGHVQQGDGFRPEAGRGWHPRMPPRSPRRSTPRSRATSKDGEPGGLDDPDVGAAGAQHRPPQQGGQRSDVGQVGAHVDPASRVSTGRRRARPRPAARCWRALGRRWRGRARGRLSCVADRSVCRSIRPGDWSAYVG